MTITAITISVFMILFLNKQILYRKCLDHRSDITIITFITYYDLLPNYTYLSKMLISLCAIEPLRLCAVLTFYGFFCRE